MMNTKNNRHCERSKTIFSKILILAFTLFFLAESAGAYPIDGFWLTGIRRLVRLQLVLKGEIKDTKPIEGARKTLNEIHLQLANSKGDSLAALPTPDAALQKKLNVLFPNLDESYSVTLLDVHPGKKSVMPAVRKHAVFSREVLVNLRFWPGFLQSYKAFIPVHFQNGRSC